MYLHSTVVFLLMAARSREAAAVLMEGCHLGLTPSGCCLLKCWCCIHPVTGIILTPAEPEGTLGSQNKLMLPQQEESSSKAPLMVPLYLMASVFQRLTVLWEQRVVHCGQRTLQPCFPRSPPHLPVSVPWKPCNLPRLSALHRLFFARTLLCDFFSSGPHGAYVPFFPGILSEWVALPGCPQHSLLFCYRSIALSMSILVAHFTLVKYWVDIKY